MRFYTRFLLILCAIAVFALPSVSAFAQPILKTAQNLDEIQSSNPVKASRAGVTAARLDGKISIDGVVDEGAWLVAPIVDGFTQAEPNEGQSPSERSEVRVLYDDAAIYIGAILYDSSPDSIVARLGRRDANLDSDAFGFFVDPYLDRRTGYYFAINAAGTMMDGVLQNDDWDDDSWDGVWVAKVHRHDEGWSTEMRIPYSQLRFQEKETYTWGVNFRRDISRLNEENFLVITPREESGFVSRFADLSGIENISPPRQIEVTPYVTSRAAYTETSDGDPFNDGSHYNADFGADFKIGLSSNTTLNGTVNPDFGQVEVDPAVVNLSDFETFFPEKRPFFVEGASIFNFGSGGANNNWGFNWSNVNLFYSRRIGRSPQGRLPSSDFADVPDGSRILGAGKLTGTAFGGWKFGTVQAMTGRTKADISVSGIESKSELEPLTYYGVTRGQKEYNDGFRSIGFMSTAAVRNFSDQRLRSQINSGAYTGSIDGWTFLDNDRVWVVTGWASGSHVTGSTDRILQLQQNSQHYFQRPDSDALELDSSATSLTGFATRVALNKQSGRWRNNTAVGIISPGYEINDLGFQSRTNVINAHSVFNFRWTEPRGIYRYWQINAAGYFTRDFDGNFTGNGIFANSFVQFKNYFSVFAGGSVNPKRTNTRLSRGGPKISSPLLVEGFFGFETDSRKNVVMELEGFAYTSKSGSMYNVEPSVEIKPAANLSVSVGPGYTVNRSNVQWVGRFEDDLAIETFGSRYVFANIEQKTLSGNLRVNWTFTPQLSLQLFAQPLISSGAYTGFKQLEAPNTFDFLTYGEEGSSYDGATGTADPDGAGPAASFVISDPDFNFKSLRGTAVARWEFRPGSTLYFVWTQTRDDSEANGLFDVGRSFDQLLNAKADNIFVVKLSYWLNR